MQPSCLYSAGGPIILDDEMIGDDLEEVNCDFEEHDSGEPTTEAIDVQRRTSFVKTNNFQGSSFK